MSPQFNLYNRFGACVGRAEAADKPTAQDLATLYIGNGQHIDADLIRNCGKAPAGDRDGKPLRHQNGGK